LPAYGAIALPAVASFPAGMIEEAISQTAAAGQRRRLLPAAAVMMFVLGCCLFYGEGYREVARKLAGQLAPLAGPGGWRVPGSAALTRARRRLGPAPFAALFAALAGPLNGPFTPGAYAFGRLALAVDGTTLDVPYTPANLAAYGPPPRGNHGQGGYPQIRLVTLAGCGTRGLAAAAFGSPRRKSRGGFSEQALTIQLAAGGALGPGMLVLGDRNLAGHNVVTALTAAGADVLIRVKSTARLPVLALLPDQSYLSVLPDPKATARRLARNGKRRRRGSKLPPDPPAAEGIPVRVIEADITATPARGHPATARYRLITTILDPADAPAAQVAATYAQRWEAETGYQELKTFLRGPGRVLRSATPAGIEQETWALLCAAQLIHTTRAHAAARIHCDPDRISFTVTLRATRRRLTTGQTQPDTILEILTQTLPPHRRRRTYPRAPHATTNCRRKLAAARAGPVTYTITITPPPAPDQNQTPAHPAQPAQTLK
jgi:hypothetical protein